MRAHYCLMLAVSAAAILVCSTGRGVEFNELKRFDVSFAFDADLDGDDIEDNPKYIGTNPLGVAWDGAKLYLAGIDNFGDFAGAGLIEVLDTTVDGEVVVGDDGFSDAFGKQFPPIGRGYTGLAISDNRLAASYDPGNPADALGIQVFDTSDNSKIWDLSASSTTARGGSGVAFDPGFPGGDAAQGTGVAWTTFGSGRRALNNTETGAIIHDLNDGMQWIPDSFPVNFARDMDFDPETGDIYVRRSNDLDVATRTGDNATNNRITLVDNSSDGQFQLGQKVEFLNNTVDGDLIIFNERSSSDTGTDIPFLDAVKVIDKDGGVQSATFSLLGGETGADIPNGSAIYDFDFDEVSQTLALLDFTNRTVSIFQVGPVDAGVVGDYNDNGVVDAADYTVWRDNLGASISLPNEDPGTTPGQVTQEDYDLWVSRFGATTGASLGAAGSPVPEPANVVLLLLSVGLPAALGRRSRWW